MCSMSMQIQTLVGLCLFVLRILSRNNIMKLFNGHTLIKEAKITITSNHFFLKKCNKICAILFICCQDIRQI